MDAKKVETAEGPSDPKPKLRNSLEENSGGKDSSSAILGNYNKDIKHVLKDINYSKSRDFGPKNGGYNVLNIPDDWYKTPEQFWGEYNKPFLDEAISRGDNISMATNPLEDPNLLMRPDGTLKGFGREYQYLRKNGYSHDVATIQMVK